MVKVDEEIKLALVDDLEADDSIDAEDIEVETRERVVILRGSVPTFQQYLRTAEKAQALPGTLSVENELKVKLPEPESLLADEEIERGIQLILFWNRVVTSEGIKVWVHKGRVSLEGTVDAFWKLGKVEDLIAGVAGVTGLSNNLAIVPTRNEGDQAIAENIMASLKRCKVKGCEEVQVEVAHGNVILSGIVSDKKVARSACDAAMFARGVVSVKNKMSFT